MKTLLLSSVLLFLAILMVLLAPVHAQTSAPCPTSYPHPIFWTATALAMPTRTTVPLQTITGGSFSPVYPTSTLIPLYELATQFAYDRTHIPNYNASTAIVLTANAYNTSAPSPTQDGNDLTPVPTPSAPLYRVQVSLVNIRQQPNTSAAIVGGLRQGEVVGISQTTTVGAITWGKLRDGRGWVALAQNAVVYLAKL
jgi:hypothetical protein